MYNDILFSVLFICIDYDISILIGGARGVIVVVVRK